MRVPSRATERVISVTRFSTIEFVFQVAVRRAVEIFEIMHEAD